MIKALLFDVFGTVVDWRTSIIEHFRNFELETQIKGDWEKLTDLWRQSYQPSMEKVRNGSREWVNLDTLHQESLLRITKELKIDEIENKYLNEMTLYWHDLNKWKDVTEGLNKLKSKFSISTLSNGGIELLTNLSLKNNIIWDNIFSAETFKCYKPDPKTYLGATNILNLQPEEVLMVAAHNQDLEAARSCNLKTAFVCRPTEYGKNQKTDLQSENNNDYSTTDFVDLYNQII